jgi:hypothetical protein
MSTRANDQVESVEAGKGDTCATSVRMVFEIRVTDDRSD